MPSMAQECPQDGAESTTATVESAAAKARRLCRAAREARRLAEIAKAAEMAVRLDAVEAAEAAGWSQNQLASELGLQWRTITQTRTSADKRRAHIAKVGAA